MPFKFNPFTGEFDLVNTSGGGGGGVLSVDADVGSAAPNAFGVLDVVGGTGVNTAGAGSTLTINIDSPVTVANGGTGLTTLTDGAILVGDGTNAVELLGPLTDGQLLIGNTGSSPTLSTLTAGAGVTILNAPGSITLSAAAATPIDFTTDSGTATESGFNINIVGGAGIDTSGAGDTITIEAGSDVATDYGTDSGTANPVLNKIYFIGGTGVDTSGAGDTVTINASPVVATTYTTDSGSAVPALNVINVTGGTGINTTGSASTVVVNLDSPVTVPHGGTGLTTLTNGGILLGSGTGNVTVTAQPTNGQLLIGRTSLDPVLATLTAGNGVSITNASGSITIASSGGGFNWVEVTGTTQAISAQTGYIANNAGLVTLTLPATAVVGDTFQIVGKGAGLFKIAQNALQTIHYVASDTTTGVGGSLTAIEQYAAIEIVCITANSDFAVLDSSGNFTVV